jgi:hypothetical protein
VHAAGVLMRVRVGDLAFATLGTAQGVIPSHEARNLCRIVRIRLARKRFLAKPLGMTPVDKRFI